MKLHHISMYRWDVYFCMGNGDVRMVSALMDDKFGEGIGKSLGDIMADMSCNGQAVMRSDYRISVININVDSMHERDCSIEYLQSVVAHEAVHVTTHLCKFIGYNPIESGDDEPFAYLMGDLVFEGLCELKSYINHKKYRFRSAARVIE